MKFAIYARVSTKDKQDYQRQINELTRKIHGDYGDSVDIDVFAEKLSGMKGEDERPEFQRMMETVRNNPELYKCIYVSELSRLGRRALEMKVIITELNELKVRLYIHTYSLYTLTPEGKIDPIANLIITILGELAEIELRNLKTRIISGLLDSAMSGKAMGGQFLPYGYTKDQNKMLIPHEEESKVIERIFDLYENGYGSKAISTILNRDKVPTKSEIKYNKKIPWSDSVVLTILKNPIYKGERLYQGSNPEPITISIPPIIDAETWDKCNEIRITKSHKNYVTKYDYLLKGISSCGVCGRNYFGKFKPTKNGDKLYLCSSRLKTGGNCGNGGINISLVESAIWNEIVSNDTIIKHLNQNDDVLKRLNDELKKLGNSLQIIDDELTEVNKQMDRATTAYLSSVMDLEIYKTNINRLKILKENANKKRVTISKKKRDVLKAIERHSNIENTITSLDKSKHDRAYLINVYRQFIGKIIINKINYHYTLATVYIGVNIDVSDMNQFKRPLKLLLDVGSIRKKDKKFRYYALDRELTAEYENGKLITPITEIESEIEVLDAFMNITTIPKKNILTIEH